MQRLGADVRVVSRPHPERGLLGARLDLVRRLCEEHNDYYWLNQYANTGNWTAHYQSTAPQIARHFPDLGVLFVGAGTDRHPDGLRPLLPRAQPRGDHRRRRRGRLGRLRRRARPRLIPGVGTSVRPATPGRLTPRRCRHRPREGHQCAPAGRCCARASCSAAPPAPCSAAPSAGCARTARRAADRPPPPSLPDLGERYLDTVHDDAWVGEAFGPETSPRTSRRRPPAARTAHIPLIPSGSALTSWEPVMTSTPGAGPALTAGQVEIWLDARGPRAAAARTTRPDTWTSGAARHRPLPHRAPPARRRGRMPARPLHRPRRRTAPDRRTAPGAAADRARPTARGRPRRGRPGVDGAGPRRPLWASTTSLLMRTAVLTVAPDRAFFLPVRAPPAVRRLQPDGPVAPARRLYAADADGTAPGTPLPPLRELVDAESRLPRVRSRPPRRGVLAAALP